MAGGPASSLWPTSLQGSLCGPTISWRPVPQLRQLPQQQLPTEKAVWPVQQWPGPQRSSALLRQASRSNLHAGFCVFDSLSFRYQGLKCSIEFQASRPQKETWWWLPSQLPSGKRRPSSGLQEDARAPASRSTWARPLQQALPPWQTTSAAGPSLTAGPEVPPGLPLSARAARRAQHCCRSQLEQQENIK